MDPPARRRRRRRRGDKAAVSGRLVLDDHVKSDGGILSEDLFAELFPQMDDALDSDSDSPPPPLFVAIAPWAPSHSPSTTSWTVVPVARSSALAPSTIQFSPSSLALQSFAATLKRVAPSKLSSHSRSGIEILVLDAAAVPLDAVYVSLEGESAKRLEDGEGTFFAQHPADHTNGNSTAPAAQSPQDRLSSALRTALGTLRVVHTDDLFPLPLAPHPVTHIPPGPGRVALCEPVAQGILTPRTRVVVSRGRLRPKHGRDAAPIPSKPLNGVAEDDDDDTSNDQFYSAAEEKANAQTDSVTETEEEEEELSDDSLDDVISLQTPTLPATAASGVSTMQPGTPFALAGRGRKATNGISTPGSVFSSFTATTARPDRPRGRLFRAQGLTRPIPAELLHPKPQADDDDEVRVYVDVRDLAKVGCFSGDWVRMEASEEKVGFGSLGSPAVAVAQDEPRWRPARIYGLPEGYTQKPVTRIPSSRPDERRLSFFESQMRPASSPAAYLSPILLANLDGPPCLRFSPLAPPTSLPKGRHQQRTRPQPPVAREVTVQQLRTPVTTDREVQTAVMAGLKGYFESKLRVLRAGDLVAIPIDAQLGRTLREPGSAGGDSAVDDFLGLSGKPDALRCSDVAWFKVGHAQAAETEDGEDGDDNGYEATWGSVVAVDVSVARLEQTGSVTGRVPGTMDSTWRHYLGLTKPPLESIAPPSAPASPLRRRLRELLAAATSRQAVHFKMPALAILLVSTQRAVGKAATTVGACLDVGLHSFVLDAFDMVSDAGAGGSDVKTEGLLRVRAERALSCGPESCVLLLRHVEALTAERMVSALRDVLAGARVLVATTTEVDKVPDAVRGLFSHEIDVAAPDEAERRAILQSVVDERGIALDPQADLGAVALKTAALVAGDLVDVVDRALVARRDRLEKMSLDEVSVRDVEVAGGPAARGLTRDDWEVAVDAARRNFADSIGAPKIPSVTWDDVGGLGHVKEAVRETIQLPLERPELFAAGMKKRSGILLYGPPGTGKTLLAKAIATEYSLNFFSVKGPELLNMYIGESEANVRRVFQRARDARPCVVFFDELDSVAPKRGNQGDSGGVMDRIVSQLLAELDGMSGGGSPDAGGVFVVGATNRPDLLDQALLRPGRFDKMLYLGVSDTHEKQLRIMEALTRKFTLHPSASLARVAESLPFTYTGADLYALCSDAMLKAVTRQAGHVDARIREINSTSDHPISTAAFFDHHATPDDLAVVVAEPDFFAAHAELVPSVSAGELAHYEHVRATFEGDREQNRGQEQATGTTSTTPKGKEKAKTGPTKNKGKGKAVHDDDDGPAVLAVNGRPKGKGKAPAAFHDGASDEGLYD